MATIDVRRNKAGKITGYRLRCCVGRDDHDKQIWRTKTISRPVGLTPRKEEEEVKQIAKTWERAQKAEYEKGHNNSDREKISFQEFVEKHWLADHVNDGDHAVSSVQFFDYCSAHLIGYFGKKKLAEIDTEQVKKFIKYLNTEAVKKEFTWSDIECTVSRMGKQNVVEWKADNGLHKYRVQRMGPRSKDFNTLATLQDTTLYTDDSPKATVLKHEYRVQHYVETKGTEPLSQSTKHHLAGTLKNILRYAKRMHYIESDPFDDLTQKERPQREKKGIDFLDSKEAARFLACLEAESLFWKCLFNVLITTGLRRGEAVGLQWGDLDDKKLTLSVVRNVTHDKKAEGGLSIGKTKTGESRVVPVSKRLCTMLQSLKAAREYDLSEKDEEGNVTVQVNILPSGFIFSTPSDPYKPVRPDSVTTKLRRFIEANHLPDVSPHDLRHSAASLALESGATLKEIQELLGHKDPSTTMKYYSGVSEEVLRRAVDGIESLIVKTS